MLDVIETIRRFNAGREPERLAMKYAYMRASPFVFLRGTYHLFYDRLSTAPLAAGAPAAWICGDLHLENFGSYKGDNRLVYFDVNDFDESALAPVRYAHTKLMLIDPLGNDPIVITGSANFSDASTTDNDENMLVIRGDTRVADVYIGEFMRLWRHHNFRYIVTTVDAASGEPVHNYLRPDDDWVPNFYKVGMVKMQRRLSFA